jgi:hypothetical protein
MTTTVSTDPPLPFLIRLSMIEISPTSGQRILPQQHLSFELEFFNFCDSLQAQAMSYEMKIEIDYLSTFPGVEKYLSIPEAPPDSMDGSTEQETTETVFIRK